MSLQRALLWVSIWVGVAILVTIGVFQWGGHQHGIEFLTCYLIEWTLSVDNLFVFLLIFRFFGVDPHHQLRALEWGIIGAIVFRMIFILLGLFLVNLFEPVLYLFGLILIWSGFKMATHQGEQKDVSQNIVVKWLSRKFPITQDFVNDRFFVKINGVIHATPMVLVVATIESSDIMFAIDSVPAAFAITRNPWIILGANILAILGLRSIFFLLSHADQRFSYLRYGVSVILIFVGLKMIVKDLFHIPALISLSMVILTLGGSVTLSIMKNKRKPIIKEIEL